MDMSNRATRIKVIAGIAGAVVLAVALGATGAIAASRALSAGEGSQAIIDDAADQLGVESTDLSDALKQALKNRVDAAVEAGRLTEEQGDELKERIDSGALPLLFGGFGHKGFAPGPWHGGAFGGLDAAASYLGVTEDELRSELASGKTLAAVAEAEGKPVDGLVDAMVEAAEARIDQAVADGKLTQERADSAKEGLEEQVTAVVNGELRGERLGRGPGHGRGFGFHRGPWNDEQPGS